MDQATLLPDQLEEALMMDLESLANFLAKVQEFCGEGYTEQWFRNPSTGARRSSQLGGRASQMHMESQ